MISYKEASSFIMDLASSISLGTEVIPLALADGRICSENILSPEPVPSFDNSAMDGFAIQSDVTLGATIGSPIYLKVASIVAAGDDIESYGHEIRAIEIMTGAPVPSAFDAVVKIEDVELTKDEFGKITQIKIQAPVPIKNNIREVGTDYKVGQLVLPSHTRIKAESMMALASLGISEISVFKKPHAALLSTGKELVPYETKILRPGLIRNSTAIYINTALTHMGAHVIASDTMGDEPTQFKNYILEILNKNIDFLVTTGAVSMGKYDFIVPSLLELGAKIIFHKVAIRPGKPILLATIERSDRSPLVIFGMPGNPVSTAVGCRFFLYPFLRRLHGWNLEKVIKVKLSEETKKPKGLTCFFKGRLQATGEGISVKSLSGQASYMVNSLVEANVWIEFPETGIQVNQNELVSVYSLLPNQSFEIGD